MRKPWINLPRVVVSMTTSPHRMARFQPVINSLLRQSLRPDAWYLNLPRFYRNSQPYEIPDWLRKIDEITINTEISEDWGPAMKLLPTIRAERDPDTVIITIDDDVTFPVDALRAFVDSARLERNTAFCSMGFSFESETYIVRPVRGAGMECDVLQGYSGCCYRRAHFDESELLRTLADLPSHFRINDDVILSNHIAGNGTQRKTIQFSEGRLDFMPWSDDDPDALKIIGPGTHSRYQELRQHLQERDEWHLTR